MRGIVDELRENGPRADEFERARAYSAGRRVLAFENTNAVARYAANQTGRVRRGHRPRPGDRRARRDDARARERGRPRDLGRGVGGLRGAARSRPNLRSGNEERHARRVSRGTLPGMSITSSAGGGAACLRSSSPAQPRRTSATTITTTSRRTSRSSCWPSTTSTATCRPPTTGGIRPPTPAPAATAPAPIPAGGAAFLGSYVRELERKNRNSLLVAGGRPDRRQPAAVGALPRRADDRGDEPDRPRPRRRSATTSSTRARPSSSACSAAAATRPTAARTATASRGADFRFLAANVVSKRQRQAVLPALRDPPLPGQEDRVHRHDARGHAEHRLAVGHREPPVPRRGRDRQPLRARAQAPPRRQGDRRAAARGRLPGRARSTPTRSTRCNGVTGPILDIVKQHDRRRRPVHHRPHASGLQLRDRRPPGHAARARSGRVAHRHRPRRSAAQRATSSRSAPTTSRSYPDGRTPPKNVTA